MLRNKIPTLSTSLNLIITLLFCFCSSAYATQEREVIFDSNESGTFGIYAISLDGTKRRPLIDTPAHEMYPSVSPDARQLLYALSKGSDVHTPRDIWIARIDGTEARLLVKNGSFPGFSSDGKTAYFLRERRKIMEIDLESKQVKEIFPLDVKPFVGRELAVPRVSPDGRYIAFTVDYPHKWKTWVYDRTSGDYDMLGHGCEPFWHADSKQIYWVRRGKFKSVTALSVYDVVTKRNRIVEDAGEPHGQEYFPSADPQGGLLVWSACPKDQHSHETANYQLFWKRPGETERTRLSVSPHTDRWPTVVPSVFSERETVGE